MKAIKFLLPALLALASAPFRVVPACAQASTPKDQQTFDYTPRDNSAQLEQPAVQTTYDDAEVINSPVYGTLLLSKNRWKSWVGHAMYLALINIALMAIILSLSKTEEYNIVISYILSGAGMTLSFWIFLCAILLFQLHANAWLYVLPVSVLLAAIGYIVLLKIKKYDVSLAELKESFKKMRSTTKEDPRLASVEGVPGDWPEQDFLK
jgi:hypothetical protein